MAEIAILKAHGITCDKSRAIIVDRDMLQLFALLHNFRMIPDRQKYTQLTPGK